MGGNFSWARIPGSQSARAPPVPGRREPGAGSGARRCHVGRSGRARGAGWRHGERSQAAAMAAALLLCSALLCAALGCAGAALIPPAADVKVEVLHKPFLCHRRTKWGDMMLVHYEGYLERDGSMFHST